MSVVRCLHINVKVAGSILTPPAFQLRLYIKVWSPCFSGLWDSYYCSMLELFSFLLNFKNTSLLPMKSLLYNRRNNRAYPENANFKTCELALWNSTYFVASTKQEMLNSHSKIYRTYNEMLRMYLGGAQMSNFLTVHPTGLLHWIMHKIIISDPNALIFGRLVPW